MTEDFLACFAELPETVKAQARKSYRLWKDDPSHPGLRFKRIHNHEAMYSIRVGKGWRALGLMEGDVVTLVLDRVARGIRCASGKAA